MVTSWFHTKMGMRNMTMPGARRQKMVVMMLTAVKIPEKPVKPDAEDPHVGAGTGGVDGFGERGVAEPPEVGRAVVGQELRPRSRKPPRYSQ